MNIRSMTAMALAACSVLALPATGSAASAAAQADFDVPAELQQIEAAPSAESFASSDAVPVSVVDDAIEEGAAATGPESGTRSAIWGPWRTFGTSRAERTSGLFGSSARINYIVSARRSRAGGIIQVRAAATQYPGRLRVYYATQEIHVYRVGSSSRARYTCRASEIPASTNRPFFGGYVIRRSDYFRCNVDVALFSRGEHRVEGYLCYDIRNDGRGRSCLTAPIHGL